MRHYSWDRAHVTMMTNEDGELVPKHKQPDYPPIKDENGRFTDIKNHYLDFKDSDPKYGKVLTYDETFDRFMDKDEI